jgi:hypothetical protein
MPTVMSVKARLATVLSLTGVLVAGSAAALVNTQVLNSSTTARNTVQFAGQTTQVGSSLPLITVPIVTSAGGSTTTAPADAHQAVYQIDQAGIVTLSKAGDVLSIVSIAPSPGWLVTKAEQEDPLNIEVTFQTGFIEIEFHANLLFGVVGTSVEATTLPSVPATASTVGAGGSNSTTPITITITSTPSTGTVDDDGAKVDDKDEDKDDDKDDDD